MSSNLVPQILFVLLGIGAVVTVIVTLPDGPPIPRKPCRRPRRCGHRHGPWICVQTDCDGTHHYYRRAA